MQGPGTGSGRELARRQRPGFFRTIPAGRDANHREGSAPGGSRVPDRRGNRSLYALLPKGASPKVSLTADQRAESPIQKFVLPNGLRLLVKEDHRLPFVEFRTVFAGGVLAETAENNGITLLMGRLLLKGTARRSAEEIALEIESIGGSMDSYGGNNSFGVNVEVLSSDFAVGLDLLSDVLLHPVFPAGSVERERQIQLAGIKSQKDDLVQTASRAMRKAMFGSTGYGLTSSGTEESVARLTVSDLKAFHQKLAVPNNCVLAVFGDVKAKNVLAAITKAFGRWKPDSNPCTPETMVKGKLLIIESLQRVGETRDKKQAVLVIGFPGTTLHSPERYALELLAESCSDLGSRLFMRIREQLGLAYYVGAQNFLGLAPGYFAFYTGTEPAKAAQVEKELLKEAGLLRSKGLTAAELSRAKAKIIGQKKIGRQDLGSLAIQTGLDELYGLGFDYSDTEDVRYTSVTLEQIKQAANQFLDPRRLVISTVLPAGNCSPNTAKADSVAELQDDTHG